MLHFNRYVNIDLVDKLPEGSKLQRYLIVCVDACSKYVEIKALKHKTARNVANWFLTHIVSRYGRPCVVRTDNGTEY